MVLFGTSPAVLRGLPFLFLVLTAAVVYLSARRMEAGCVTAAFAAAIPFAYPMLVHYGTEIRAYSMEACAVAILFFASAWIHDRRNGFAIGMFGCLAALFAASRYSAFIYAAAACLTALFPLRPLAVAMKRTALLSTPIVLSVVAGYWVFARHQAGGTHRPPAYVEGFLLHGKEPDVMLSQLSENLFSPSAIPITSFLIIGPFFFLLGPRLMDSLRRIVGRISLFAWISVLFTAFASLAGRLPWGLHGIDGDRGGDLVGTFRNQPNAQVRCVDHRRRIRLSSGKPIEEIGHSRAALLRNDCVTSQGPGCIE
jgi:hypothetical protein